MTAVEPIMHAFGERTGVTSSATPRRYLWTDAFAVGNYLALHRHSGSTQWLNSALQLIHQVHHVLGRHRPDDARAGWISGLADAEGERHPTAGGLRIGKPLPERTAPEPPDERVDWERDGQYYHYLTRWMHALERVAYAGNDAELLRYGEELATAAHAAFLHTDAGEKRLYWKMSVDLSNPVVTSMGQHDALDGLVVTAALHEQTRRRAGADCNVAHGLQDELTDLSAMCHGRGWATADALGIGGLLTDALFLARMTPAVPGLSEELIARVLHDAARSLDLATTGRFLAGPAAERLPFRELGLSLGLAAVERLDQIRKAGSLPGGATSASAMDRLVRHVPLRSQLEEFWLEPAHQRGDSWTGHEDINAVMLATSILPDGYLD